MRVRGFHGETVHYDPPRSEFTCAFSFGKWGSWAFGWRIVRRYRDGLIAWIYLGPKTLGFGIDGDTE